jgi:hypothetical protein
MVEKSGQLAVGSPMVVGRLVSVLTKSVIVLYLLAAVHCVGCPASSFALCSHFGVVVSHLASVVVTARAGLVIWLQGHSCARAEAVARHASALVSSEAVNFIVAWGLFTVGWCLQELLFPGVSANF